MGKDPYEIGEQNNEVYKISFNCGKCHVGQTKRPLRIRIYEHFKNFNPNEKFLSVCLSVCLSAGRARHNPR